MENPKDALAAFVTFCEERGHDVANLSEPVKKALLKSFEEQRLLQANNAAAFTSPPEG